MCVSVAFLRDPSRPGTQAALTAAGIPSVIVADDAGGAYPFGLAGGAHLLVDEVDADDAAEFLSGGQGSVGDDSPRAKEGDHA